MIIGIFFVLASSDGHEHHLSTQLRNFGNALWLGNKLVNNISRLSRSVKVKQDKNLILRQTGMKFYLPHTMTIGILAPASSNESTLVLKWYALYFSFTAKQVILFLIKSLALKLSILHLCVRKLQIFSHHRGKVLSVCLFVYLSPNLSI